VTIWTDRRYEFLQVENEEHTVEVDGEAANILSKRIIIIIAVECGGRSVGPRCPVEGSPGAAGWRRHGVT